MTVSTYDFLQFVRTRDMGATTASWRLHADFLNFTWSAAGAMLVLCKLWFMSGREIHDMDQNTAQSMSVGVNLGLCRAGLLRNEAVQVYGLGIACKPCG